MEGLGLHGAALPPAPEPLPRLSLAGLKALRAHRADELVVVAEAGMSLAELQGHLAQAGQWLPAQAPGGQASLGGLLATDRTGMWQPGHGRLADRLLWVEAVGAQGQRIHSGAQVVKSVAGYDWGRLLVGSQGAFGAIVAVALKVAPLPPHRLALRWQGEDLKAWQGLLPTAWGEGLAALELAREAGGPWRIQAWWEGHPSDLRRGPRQGPWGRQAGSTWSEDPLEQGLWLSQLGGGWDGAEACFQWQGPALAWPEGLLATQVGRVQASPLVGRWQWWVHGPEEAEALLRAWPNQGGAGSWRLRPGLEAARALAWGQGLQGQWWGPLGASAGLLRALKAQEDPQGRWQGPRLQAVWDPGAELPR